MISHFAKLLILCTYLLPLSQAQANNRCDKIKHALNLLDGPKNIASTTPRLGSQLKEADVKLLLTQMQDAYKKGGELQKLQYELMDIQKAGQMTPEIQARVKAIEQTYLKTQNEISILNDAYLNQMHALYKADGIPSQLVKSENGSLVLKLDLKSPPTNKRAYEFYRRVQSRFGLNEVTLSLKDNAEAGFAGFFNPGTKRIEMGPNQGFSMLEDYFNSVSKHESRHAMFAHKRMIGDDSIFHTTFHASNQGELLNADKMYDSFMSTEELYTYSTDFQSLAQVMTKDYVSDIAKRSQILNQIAGHHELFTKIVASTKNVSAELVTSLDELIKKPNRIGSAFINQREDGKLSFTVMDRLKRRAEIALVGAEEKAQGKLLLEAQKNYNLKLEEVIIKNLSQNNVNIDDMVRRANINQLTLQEQTLIAQAAQKAQLSPEMIAQTKQVEERLLPLLKNAKDNMSQLNALAKNQEVAGQKLGDLLKSIPTDPKLVKLDQVEALKHQMFLTSKSVKEDYKGFALNK